ncbi:hypothetical protein L1887_37464 [Cichorium endivia]|nr:hypothetical protein L1887_37464 [Cichorium endivia]
MNHNFILSVFIWSRERVIQAIDRLLPVSLPTTSMNKVDSDKDKSSWIEFSLGIDVGSSHQLSRMQLGDLSDQDREPFIEVDSSGSFRRYRDLLGAGAVNKIIDYAKPQLPMLRSSDTSTVELGSEVEDISSPKAIMNYYHLRLTLFVKK